jgi:hypothetical protein
VADSDGIDKCMVEHVVIQNTNVQPWLDGACREKDKKKKKGGDADAESGGESPGSTGEDGAADGEGDVVWMTDTSEQAAKDRAQAQLTKAMADMVTQVSFAAVLFLS